MKNRSDVFFLVLLSVIALLASCMGKPATMMMSKEPVEAAEPEAAPPSPVTEGAPAESEVYSEESKAASESPAVSAMSKSASPAEQAVPAASGQKPASSPDAPDQVAAARDPIPDQGTTRYLSADDSNSAASPVIARRLIRGGRFVQPALVRTYEFLNYYGFGYQPPAEGPAALYPQMRPTETEGEYSLQIAVRGRDRTLAEVAPLSLTMVIDVSGSMAGEPIELAGRVVRGITARLRPGDRLSLVTCARSAKILLENHQVGGATASRVGDLLAALRPADVTDLGQGVRLAYELASRNYDYRYLNRVVVISDGADNVNPEAEATIARNAEDSDRQGIYLAGIGVGEGFNDQLMNRFTDKGRGAYLFVDSASEVERLLSEASFVSIFDLALKNVRLKMVMPPDWRMTEFHGEQVSARASDVVPQYLAANDQMIYHLVVATGSPGSDALRQPFTFEAELTPVPGRATTVSVTASPAEMLANQREILKGDAVVAYAELLKAMQAPLEEHTAENLLAFAPAVEKVREAARELADPELEEIASLLAAYRRIIEFGEQHPGSLDGQSESPEAALGVPRETVLKVSLRGRNPRSAVKAIRRLGSSARLTPLEGYRFLVLSSGPVGNPSPAGTGKLASADVPDPRPAYMGSRKVSGAKQRVFDLHQVVLELKAPDTARSLSFDFNFFSAEYPEYINQSYNDTFYAILEAPSTNGGSPTNIAFDANGSSIEVDNNYFQQPFHPIPNAGTGFDAHGSTGWLRTSWPVRGGEELRLAFSIHDEGDAIYDSLVLLDNFRWHDFEAVGATDPLN